MRAVIVLLASITWGATVPVQAQQRVKMGFELMNFLKERHAPDAQLDLFIHGPADAVAAAVRSHGGLVKRSLPHLSNVRVPIAAIPALEADPAVKLFEFTMAPVYLLNDSARVKSRVNEIHLGMPPLPEAYQGEGVVVGVIDTGLDPTHPDMQNEDGTTRVVKYWDQVIANGPLTPAQYGYGQVWTAAHIDAGQMTSQDNSGHGTSVAGIAAGNGMANGRHKGMAPKADLIIVKNPVGGSNFYSTVVDAIDFIFAEADALGKPAVVNLSIGRRMGSHDGLDAAAQLIDAMLEEKGGRVVVCAAGNFDDWNPYHLRTNVTADTSFTWFQYNPNLNFGNNIIGGIAFEAWGDADELENVQFAIGADRVAPSYQFRGNTPFRALVQNAGTTFTDTLYSLSGNRIGVVQTLALQRGGQYQVFFQMVQPDTTNYLFRLMSTGSGLFDVWSSDADNRAQMRPYHWPPPGVTVPTPAEYAPMIDYVHPDNHQHITDSWTCSPNVITVGNYRNETAYTAYNGQWVDLGGVEGEINIPSSRGPTRDDRLKPEIAAPGETVFSAYPTAFLNTLQTTQPDKLDAGGMHIRGGGTSATSPHVAGVVALYLQKCPLATFEEVRSALFTTAVADEFTGPVPNYRWGHGKLDAFAALNTSNIDGFDMVQIGDDPFCEGETVVLQAPDGYFDYLWSNGVAGESSISYGDEGPVSVRAFNPSYCSAYSDTLIFEVLEAPEAPVITVDGTTLTSSVSTAYQWYLNGQPIPGAEGELWEALENGDYQVEAIADNGCSAMSDPVWVIVTAVEAMDAGAPMIWPSPAKDELYVRLARPEAVVISLHDASGRRILERKSDGDGLLVLPLKELPGGTYHLRLDDASGIRTYRFVKLP